MENPSVPWKKFSAPSFQLIFPFLLFPSTHKFRKLLRVPPKHFIFRSPPILPDWFTNFADVTNITSRIFLLHTFPRQDGDMEFSKKRNNFSTTKNTFDFFGTLRQKRSKQKVSFQPQRLFSKKEAPKNQHFLPAHTFLKINTKIKYDAPTFRRKFFLRKRTPVFSVFVKFWWRVGFFIVNRFFLYFVRYPTY